MYYDWNSVFSRQVNGNARLALVIAARSVGKTFGLRLRCIKDYMKRGKKFIELVRYDSELKDAGSIRENYFGRIKQLGYYPDYIFRVDGNKGYIAEESDNPKWREIMQFVSLSRFQKEKKKTFSDIGRIIFDEFIIDRRDRYSRYLKDEYQIFAEMISTITREDNSNADTKVYMLGNAVDFASCPYFEALGIDEIPSFGFHYYKNKSILLHYVSPAEYDIEQDKTLAYKLLEGSDEHATMFGNKFLKTAHDYIKKRTSDAKYSYSLSFLGDVLSVWMDYKHGLVFVSQDRPKSESVYALTTEDNKINYMMVKRSSAIIKSIVDLYYSGYIYYENYIVKDRFRAVMNFLGVR